MTHSQNPLATLIACTVLLIAAAAPTARAHALKLELDELTHAADVVFVGTVTDSVYRRVGRDGIVFTDLTFNDLDVIHASEHARSVDDTLTLSFLGGDDGGRFLSVCCSPTLEVGHRYLIFARHDGSTPAIPAIGGPQGVFPIIRDTQSGEAIPVTYSGNGIRAVTDGRMATTERVTAVAAKIASVRTLDDRMAPAPEVFGAPGRGSARSRTIEPTATILSLSEFADAIRDIARGPAPERSMLRGIRPTDSAGTADKPKFHEGTPRSPLDQWEHEFALAEMTSPSMPGASGPVPADDGRAALCTCGFVDVLFDIEQVSPTHWSWDNNNEIIFQFNQIMDVFRTSSIDPDFGSNGVSEIVGWIDNQTLQNVYNATWDGFLAYAFTWRVGGTCSEISQADIVFNPAYSWTQDFEAALGSFSLVNYDPVFIHELGHAWGSQTGSCVEDYTYDRLTVMHAYYSSIVEDAEGVHAWDSSSYRNVYDSQISVPARQDLGVESYFVEGGSLSNSRMNYGGYFPGSSFTLSNITIENMSSSATQGVRVRLFLSDNNIISTNDYEVGTNWGWTSLDAGEWWTGDLSADIPLDVPPGEYYVGAIISRGGAAFLGDDYAPNNNTFLYSTITVNQLPPSNDRCRDAPEIGQGQFPYDTTSATTDGPELDSECGDGWAYQDIWFEYTAPCDGALTVSDCNQSGFDSFLMLYRREGNCPPLPSDLITCDNDTPGCGINATVSADLTKGTVVLIRVGGHLWGTTGTGTLSVDFEPVAGNDDLVRAEFVDDGFVFFDITCATTDGPGHPRVCEPELVYNDLWYEYYPLCHGTLKVTTCDSATFDTALVIYERNSDGTLGPYIACNDDDPACTGGSSTVSADVTIGQGYYIRVGSTEVRTGGTGILFVDCEAGCPDANGDGDVNFADLELLLDNWGNAVPAGTLGDVNHTGFVNFFDLNLLLDNWGVECE